MADADLDTLGSLVDKSLLRVRDDRFWMLETIREFAGERLEASGEAGDLHRRHAEFFLSLAEQAEPHLRGDPAEWLARLERDHDNLRAAMDHLAESRRLEELQRLVGALWRFYSVRGYVTEGRIRLETALELDARPTPARGQVLNGATVAALHAGDNTTARARVAEALALHRQLGDAWGIAVSTQLLGSVHADVGDWRQARHH